MFNDLIIREGSVENISEAEETVGFAFDTHIAYYRGLGLSMIEPPRISVDGQRVPTEALRFSYRGQTWTFEELADVHDIRWELPDFARITVLQPGGLKPGRHVIDVVQVLRVSYMPILQENPFRCDIEILGS